MSFGWAMVYLTVGLPNRSRIVSANIEEDLTVSLVSTFTGAEAPLPMGAGAEPTSRTIEGAGDRTLYPAMESIKGGSWSVGGWWGSTFAEVKRPDLEAIDALACLSFPNVLVCLSSKHEDEAGGMGLSFGAFDEKALHGTRDPEASTSYFPGPRLLQHFREAAQEPTSRLQQRFLRADHQASGAESTYP
eukprot:GILK01020042.1.p1 GENE.GILK01020042.1~~GILK01020042.1.p1  ORF type:complete len:189 (-),score=1.32 GILK01020042.1:39-605(-)